MQGRIEADSAGIYGGHSGAHPDRRMRTAALYRGYGLSHSARQVDDQNYEDLMHLAPSVEDSHKIVRMASYLTTHNISYIPDPYYMGSEGFSLVLDLLEEGCLNLYESIEKLFDSSVFL